MSFSSTLDESRCDGSKKVKMSNAPPLTVDELSIAVQSCYNTTNILETNFPKVERNLADPIIDLQKFGLFSFIPAKGATPNEKGLFGFAKMRGNFASEQEAEQKAEQIIRDVDSVNTIYHVYIGRPFPITVSEEYSKNTTNVDIRRDAVEAVSNNIKNKKDEDRKRGEEMKKREEELISDVSLEKNISLIEEDEYVTLKVKKAQLSWTYLEHINKIVEIKQIIEKTRHELDRADLNRPDLKDSFFEKYKNARIKAGLPIDDSITMSGFTRYMVEDVVLPGIDNDENILSYGKIDLKISM